MDITLIYTRTLASIASGFYVISFLIALLSSLKGRPYLRPLFYISLITGLSFQSAGLYFRGLLLSSFPLTNIFEILQVTAWCTTFLIIIIQLGSRLRSLGLFGSAFVSLFTILSLSISNFDSHKPIANLVELSKRSNPWIEIHAALAIFAYSIFGLLAITSLMFLLQNYSLTHKRFSGLFQLLPSLKQLNSISHILLSIGVISLALSVILGTLTWLSPNSHVAASKIICAWILFITYLNILTLQQKQRCLPRTIAWACIILFLFAMLTLWPVHFSLSKTTAQPLSLPL